VLVNIIQELVVRCFVTTINSRSDNYFRAVNFSLRIWCLYISSKKHPTLYVTRRFIIMSLEPLDLTLGEPRTLHVVFKPMSILPCKAGLYIVLCYARNFGNICLYAHNIAFDT